MNSIRTLDRIRNSGRCPAARPSRCVSAASLRLGVIALALCVAPGCATTGGGLFKFGDREFPKADEKNPVTRVMALWQPTTGTGLDGLTCRGFAGQIFFFAGDQQLPAEVTGDVRIYVFDDQGSRDEQVKPIHEFNFPAETWKHYVAKTKLGPTYVLFIPYTRKGQHPAQCSVRVRFTPANGSPVHSDMVNVSLRGSANAGETEALASRKRGRDASADDVHSDATDTNGQGASRTHRDPAVQLAAATIEQPDPPRRAIPLTPAERQRLIEEALARQNGTNLSAANGDGLPVDAEGDVVYVRDNQPTAPNRRPASNRHTPEARSSVKTHTIELPRQ